MDFGSGVDLILKIQNLGDWLEAPMRFFTFLGTENFFMLILPILYWCVDTSLGLRMGVVLLLSSGSSEIVKLIFHNPRPYWVSVRVRPLSSETSFGTPSTHAQNAVSVWGMLASYFHKPWAWAAAAILAFLVGLSRMYLGVHFGGDVLVGWVIGAVLLFIVLRFWGPVGNWLASQSPMRQILYAFIPSLIMILMGAFFNYGLRDFTLPEEWMTNAARADALPVPVSMNSIITSAATLLGLAVGAVWTRQIGEFQASGPIEKRALRYIVGLIGIVVFWYGLGAVLPRGEALLPYILRFVRYTMVGWWVSGGAPWLFFRFKLVPSQNL